MPHISIQSNQPGIINLFDFNPSTAAPLNYLAQALLREESSLKEYERELIAAHVSSLNDCNFCYHSHAAAADALMGNDAISGQIKINPDLADVSEKMKCLLKLAGMVQKSGKAVTADAVEIAKQAGATDKEIHDTVLIAAAFSMFNRYVDGLATVSSQNKADYVEIGKMLAERGYVAV
jgi:uncharacterized peroxidase-related enzyme